MQTVLDYRSADWEGLHRTLSLINLSPLTVSDKLKNAKIWKHWYDGFMNAVYHHIPTKILKKCKSPLWFDSEIHHLLNKKETARRKAKLNSSSHSLWENFQKPLDVRVSHL